MKRAARLLACLCMAPQGWAKSPDNPVEDRRAMLQQRRAETLRREQARSRANLCEQVGDGSVPAVGQCWLREGKITNAAYTDYVRATGALLRLPPPSFKPQPLPMGPPAPLAFDAAEATWRAYREQACQAMTIQWEGGDMGRTAYPKCLVTLTWRHMQELGDLYADP